jgi:hypothetical protein
MNSEVVITDSELPAEVVAAIKEGRKVVAINLLMATTGMGMANAKVLVDRASTRLNPKPPRQTFMKDYNPVNRRMIGMALVMFALFLAYKFGVSA